MDATQRLIVEIGADKVDLTDYPPITQGDKKRMPKELGFSMREIEKLNDEQESAFVTFLLKRVRPKTTLEEVDALSAALVQDIGAHCLQRSARVDTPFSKRSTSSPASTGGPSATSGSAATQS